MERTEIDADLITDTPNVAAGEPAAPSKPIIIGDPKRVEAKLLEWHWTNVNHAKMVMGPVLSAIASDEEVYRALPKIVPTSREAEQQDAEVQTPESANQSDVVRSEYHRAMFEGTGVFRCVADPQEAESRAQTTGNVMKQMLEDAGYEDEIDDSLWDFLNSKYGGLKTVIERIQDVDGALEEVPANDIALALAEDSWHRQGTPFSPVDQTQSSVIYEVSRPHEFLVFVPRAMDPRKILFSDLRKPNIHDVPSIHEAHYWTLADMRKAGFNITAADLPPPNGTNQHEPQVGAGQRQLSHGGGNVTNPNFKQWEVWESWAEIPWRDWVEDNSLTVEDLIAFAEANGINVAEFELPQKWQFFHIENKVALRCRTNYLLRRSHYPYNVASFIKRRGELIGDSFISRIKEFEAIVKTLTNMYLDNLRQRIYGSVILDSNSPIDRSKFKSLWQRKGIVELELMGRPVEDMVKFMSEVVPDVARPALDGMMMAQRQLQTFGNPAILMGQGNSETATQDMVNNQRGQQKITAPLRRYAQKVLQPTLENIRDLISLNYDAPRWIREQGEYGAEMARPPKPVTREDITHRFRIVLTTRFDFVDRPIKAQQLTALANIVAPVLATGTPMPRPFAKLVATILEYQDVPRNVIDEITDNEGRGTNPEEELLVLEYQPFSRIVVRPDDDHLKAQLLLQAKLAQMQMTDPAKAEAFASQDNVQRWLADHQYYFMQEQAQLAAQQLGGQKGDDNESGADQRKTPQGPPNQPTPVGGVPTDQSALARQEAQLNSQPDGGMSAMGMTGRGGLAVRGGGRVKHNLQRGGIV